MTYTGLSCSLGQKATLPGWGRRSVTPQPPIYDIFNTGPFGFPGLCSLLATHGHGLSVFPGWGPTSLLLAVSRGQDCPASATADPRHMGSLWVPREPPSTSFCLVLPPVVVRDQEGTPVPGLRGLSLGVLLGASHPSPQHCACTLGLQEGPPSAWLFLEWESGGRGPELSFLGD